MDDTRWSGGRGKRVRISEAERRERLRDLVMRRSKLTPREAAVLREEFDEIIDAHYVHVWNQFRRRSLDMGEAQDLTQETFLALYEYIVEHGFPDSMQAMLRKLAEGKLLNHLRAAQRAPFTIGLPSSSSEQPGSAPDLDRAVDLRELARQLWPRLPREQQDVVDLVIFKGLSNQDAADILGIPEGTLKSRLMAAKRAMLVEAKPLLPPSQRGC